MATDRPTVLVRLVFADEGTFHVETIRVSSERLHDHERLIDFLREEPAVSRLSYLDLKRLVSAVVVTEKE